MNRALRLPLQVGTSSLEGFARAAAALMPGALLVATCVMPLVFSPWDEALDTYAKTWVVLIVPIVFGGLVLAYARKHLRLALRERPSDIVLDGEGLHVEGGALDGLRIAWSEIDATRCRVKGVHDGSLDLVESEKDKRKDNFWQLFVGRTGGSDILLASAEDAKERDSLLALRDSIVAAAKRAHANASGARREHAVTALSCARCGAPAVPADRSEVPCRYCGAIVPIPREIQERIRAVLARDASRRDAERLVEKLIRQPGARRTSVVVAMAAVPSMLVWPAIVAIAIGLYALAFLRFSNGCLLTLAAFSAIAAFFFLVRGQLSDRQALRLLTLHFSARAPAQAGAPHQCRSCSAPLVEPPGAVLVPCVYCGAENVLGLDVSHEAKEQASERSSLESALRARRFEHWRWRFGAVAAVGMLAGAVALVSLSLGPPHVLVPRGHARALERITYDPLSEFNPAPAPDGSKLLYDLRDEDDDAIMWCPPSGAFRGNEYTRTKAQARRPEWLPDGSGIVYVSEPSSKKAILERTLSSKPYSQTVELARAGHDIGVPSVSRDGKRVVYDAAKTKSSGYSLFMVPVAGGKPTNLGPGIDPVWTPDGHSIVFGRTIGRYHQLERMNVDGDAKPTPLTSDPCNHEDPVFSPDGQRILYLADCGHTGRDDDIWNVYVMHADGTGIEQLTSGDTYVETPAWTGDYIYFSANVAGNFDIWRVKVFGDLAGHGRAAARL